MALQTMLDDGTLVVLLMPVKPNQPDVVIEEVEPITLHISPEMQMLLEKYTYNPLTRFKTAAGHKRATSSQLEYMGSLRILNGAAYDEMVHMICTIWEMKGTIDFTIADAGHVISRMNRV